MHLIILFQLKCSKARNNSSSLNLTFLVAEIVTPKKKLSSVEATIKCFLVVKGKKVIGGKLKKITKKIFYLDNGAQHIIEYEESYNVILFIIYHIIIVLYIFTSKN